LLGALAHQSRREPAYYNTPAAVVPAGPVYAMPPPRPNYAVTGAFLGGVAGGVIGHNSGRKTAEGIAIGAGTGLLFGSLAEHRARWRESYAVAVPAPQVIVSQPAPTSNLPSSGQVASSERLAAAASPAGTPMRSANALFGR
jgi:hypothetical protein